MPTQKLAQKCAATSGNFFRERLQSAFTLANSFAESPNRGDLIQLVQVFKIINGIDDLKFGDFFTTTIVLNLIMIALEILSTNYMYILQKLKPRSLSLATELHQPGIHF